MVPDLHRWVKCDNSEQPETQTEQLIIKETC